MCTGAPANMTELATVCNDNCPLKPRASLADWTGRLAQEPLVWASLVTGVMSSASRRLQTPALSQALGGGGVSMGWQGKRAVS
jgi:hypothetical protein